MGKILTTNDNVILWFTGLSGSGKSTLATALEEALKAQGLPVFLLDGDKVRQGLCSDLGFSAADREENIRRVGEVAKLFWQAGMFVIGAFISPYRKDRARLRELVPEGRFLEIHVDCPLVVCEQRDPKGLYQKVRKGEIQQFTGISSPYECPVQPDIHLRSDLMDVDQCIKKILKALPECGSGKTITIGKDE